MKTDSSNLQSGQVGLVVLLIMAVVFTVAISISQRTIQEQEMAITQDESTRTFNAAESGVEKALSDVIRYEEFDDAFDSESSFLFDDSQVEYTIAQDSQFDMFLTPSDVAQIPLEQEEDEITIDWWYQRDQNCNSSPDSDPAAIVVSVLSASNAVHYAFDPCESQRDSNMQEPETLASGDYSFRVSLDVSASDRLIRLRPVFNNTRFLVSGNDSINLAQYDILSRAYNEQEDLARTINVKRSIPGAYSFMDYTLISGSSLSK